MKKIFVYIAFLLLFVGCNPCKYVSKHPECFQVDTTVIDTHTVATESIQYIVDSANLKLYLQCDSNYNVLVQDISNIDNKGEVKIIYKYSNNNLEITSYADSIEVLHTLIEKYKNETTYILNPVNNQLKIDAQKYQDRLKSRSWLWWYFGASIIILIVFLYFKIFT